MPAAPASLGAPPSLGDAGGVVSSEGTTLVAGGPDGATLEAGGGALEVGDDPAAGDSLSAKAEQVEIASRNAMLGIVSATRVARS